MTGARAALLVAAWAGCAAAALGQETPATAPASAPEASAAETAAGPDTAPVPAAPAVPDDGYVAYPGHDIAKLLGTRTDAEGHTKRFFDLAFAERVLADLARHARNYPPVFRSDEERGLARRDAQRLAELLEIVSKEPDASDDPLFLSARVNAVAHNLDVKGAGGRANSYFTRFLERQPAHPQGHFQYGAFLASTATGQQQAMPHLEQAIALGVVDAYYAMAMLSLMLGDQEKPLKNLEVYVAERPGDEQAVKLLEVLRLKDGQLKVNVKTER